jgi:hypothetical protein
MTNLSPAALAVLDAVDQVPRVLNCTQDHPLFAAAALCAAAYIVAPAMPVCDHCCDRQSQNIRHKLLAIAAELEGIS